MARTIYGQPPESIDKHDELFVETQIALLNEIKNARGASVAKAYAEAYALISGHLGAVPVEVKNG